MIVQFLKILKNTGLDLTAQEVAEILWLAEHLDQPPPMEVKPSSDIKPLPSQASPTTPNQEEKATPTESEETLQDGTSLYPLKGNKTKTGEGVGVIPLRSPVVAALPNTLGLERALRPLMYRIPSRTQLVLDEVATVQRIVDEQLWLPVLKPAPSRWLEVALVVDESPSMVIWQQTVNELEQLLERQGAFRLVRRWGFTKPEKGALNLHLPTDVKTNRKPEELNDPSGQRLILLVSDCISSLWEDEQIARWIEMWGEKGPVALVHLFPQPLWERTALGEMEQVNLRSLNFGAINRNLEKRSPFRGRDLSLGTALPVITLEPYALTSWAKAMLGSKEIWLPGVLLAKKPKFVSTEILIEPTIDESDTISLSAWERLEYFRGTTSPEAWQLAGYLAASPLTLPIMRLVQRVMMPQSQPIHLAEVFLSGLIERVTSIHSETPFNEVLYDFVSGVRELLIGTVLIDDTMQVQEAVSKFVIEHLGQPRDFGTWLADPTTFGDIPLDDLGQAFAQVRMQVLQRLGGNYARLAERWQQHLDKQIFESSKKDKSSITPLSELASTSEQVSTSSIQRGKRILVVDNDPDFRNSVEFLLRARGYTVFGASNRMEALEIALRERVHVAVLDDRLEADEDYNDISGLTLAKQLDRLIVKIIVSAYLSLPIVRNSHDEDLAFTLLGKDELPAGLLNALTQAFSKEVGINFELKLAWQDIHLEKIAHDMGLENKPDLYAEIEELLCKLFYRADEIAISPLIPIERSSSAPQSGAVVLKVQPRYQDGGWAAPVVVKLASREMIETEHRNYKRHVERYIDGFRRTSIQGLTQTHRLGGIIYSLVGAPLDECMDLGTFYTTCPAKEIITSLTNLFTRTCQLWYKNREPNQSHDLIELYAKPLKLSVHRLETALEQIDLAEWAGTANPLIPELKRQIINPIEWLRQHPTLTSNVSLCHVHGDLHSRNVLIDQNNQTWLIDFYRSGPSHIFRDLTELESDIKFILLTNSDLSALYQLELALFNTTNFDETYVLPRFKHPDLRKAFEVIQSLRWIAADLTNSRNTMLDYYQGLLLQTLTMIYRRHVSAPKKRHAYLSASLLCERLGSW